MENSVEALLMIVLVASTVVSGWRDRVVAGNAVPCEMKGVVLSRGSTVMVGWTYPKTGSPGALVFVSIVPP